MKIFPLYYNDINNILIIPCLLYNLHPSMFLIDKNATFLNDITYDMLKEIVNKEDLDTLNQKHKDIYNWFQRLIYDKNSDLREFKLEARKKNIPHSNITICVSGFTSQGADKETEWGLFCKDDSFYYYLHWVFKTFKRRNLIPYLM